MLHLSDRLDGTFSLFDASSVPLGSTSSADLADALRPPSSTQVSKSRANSNISANKSTSNSVYSSKGRDLSTTRDGSLPEEEKGDLRGQNSASATHSKAQPWRNQERHRHSPKLDKAMDCLIELADQAITFSPSQGSNQAYSLKKRGIVQNLESHGWVYHGTTQGIRIFSKEEDGEEAEDSDAADSDEEHNENRRRDSITNKGEVPPDQDSRHTPKIKHSMTSLNGRVKSGVGAHEALPYFRGEGWIEGSWKIEDIQHTIVSIGARGVWDPPFDAGKSTVVAHLSQHDNLSQVFLRGSFISNRDACIATSLVICPGEIGYVASVSVEDALVPKSGTRTTIHLNGYCLRALPEPPLFDTSDNPADRNLAKGSSSRPAHRRITSGMSVTVGPGLVLPHKGYTDTHYKIKQYFQSDQGLRYPSLQPKDSSTMTHDEGPKIESSPLSSPHARQPLMQYASYASHNSAASGRSGGNNSDLFRGEATGISTPRIVIQSEALRHQSQKAPSGEKFGKGPGVHLSLVLKASPGSNLPFTFVKNLSLNLPLSIASINQYLMTKGFAPYIIRRPRSEGMTVVEERFDAQSSYYKVLYKVSLKLQDGETKIRFFGGTFAKGNFNIQVERAKDWYVEYDVKPEEPSPPSETPEGKESETGRHHNRRPDNSMDVVLTESRQPISITKSQNSSQPSLTNESSSDRIRIKKPPIKITYPDSTESGNIKDPALQAGPKGGCTLCIPNKGPAGAMPVSVIISRSSDKSKAPLDLLKRVSKALADASSMTYEDSPIETVEQLLDSPDGERRAEMNLNNARSVLKYLNLNENLPEGNNTTPIAGPPTGRSEIGEF